MRVPHSKCTTAREAEGVCACTSADDRVRMIARSASFTAAILHAESVQFNSRGCKPRMPQSKLFRQVQGRGSLGICTVGVAHGYSISRLQRTASTESLAFCVRCMLVLSYERR